MTTNLNENGIVMIVYLVSAGHLSAKASLTKFLY